MARKSNVLANVIFEADEPRRISGVNWGGVNGIAVSYENINQLSNIDFLTQSFKNYCELTISN